MSLIIPTSSSTFADSCRTEGAPLSRKYLCAFYGGALLARTQFTSPEEAEAELVNLFRINPNIVVVCDGDQSNSNAPIKERVMRIQSEVGKIPNAHIWVHLVSIGTMDTILVHPREVFRLAIIAAASAVIVMHNHPSGESTPSEADIKVTRDLIRAGQLLKMELIDHVVIGNGNFSSLRALGYFYS
jgi:proteasome lid subunit RPN8/RPN11